MFKDKDTDEYMYPILGYDNYCISRSGKVAKCLRKSGNRDKYQSFIFIHPYLNNNFPYVQLRNNNGNIDKVSVARLNIESIYGILPFKIKYLDGNPQNVDKSNLVYDFDNYKIYDSIEVEGEIIKGPVLILYKNEKRFAIFKPIPIKALDNNRYWITRDGSIFDAKRKVLISRSNDDHGYYKVGLAVGSYFDDNKLVIPNNRTFKVYVLVYVAWSGDTDLQGMTIDHIDGRRYNNDISNLEKVTFEENIIRRNARNVDNPLVLTSRWKPELIHKICKLLEENKTYSEIAEALGISTDKNTKEYVAVCNLCKAIIDRRVFTYISKNYNIQSTSLKNKHLSDYKTPQKFDTKIIEKVCIELVSGKGPAEVSRLYPEIPLGTIQNIKTGRQYRNVSDTIPGMKELIENKKKVSNTTPKRSWSNEECELICQMLQDGKSNLEIAEALGYKYDENFPGSSEMIAVANIIQGLYTKRLHKKICDKYTFSTDRKALYFPNAGQFTSRI